MKKVVTDFFQKESMPIYFKHLKIFAKTSMNLLGEKILSRGEDDKVDRIALEVARSALK